MYLADNKRILKNGELSQIEPKKRPARARLPWRIQLPDKTRRSHSKEQEVHQGISRKSGTGLSETTAGTRGSEQGDDDIVPYGENSSLRSVTWPKLKEIPLLTHQARRSLPRRGKVTDAAVFAAGAWRRTASTRSTVRRGAG